jgi:cell wall-associated NlpC family hydrolase
LFLCLIVSDSAFALSNAYKTHFKKNIIFLSNAKTEYVWGGKGDLKDDVYQLDCSGFMYKAANMAGMPVRRTVAFNMALSLDGWNSKKVELEDCEDTDLIWWTWMGSTRKHGHVGAIVLNPASDLYEVCHASASKKRVVINPIRGTFLRDISSIRRLSLGDKK